jgi:hypothetical protein
VRSRAVLGTLGEDVEDCSFSRCEREREREGGVEKAGECNGDGGVSKRRSREEDGCWMVVDDMEEE